MRAQVSIAVHLCCGRRHARKLSVLFYRHLFHLLRKWLMLQHSIRCPKAGLRATGRSRSHKKLGDETSCTAAPETGNFPPLRQPGISCWAPRSSSRFRKRPLLWYSCRGTPSASKVDPVFCATRSLNGTSSNNIGLHSLLVVHSVHYGSIATLGNSSSDKKLCP